MYKWTGKVRIKDVPRNEPIDLYIMKRGADLIAAAVTSDTYRTAYIEVGNGIRDVEDFTRICDEHEFSLVKDIEVPKKYDLEFDFDMRNSLCTVNDAPCIAAELPNQLVDYISG